MSSAAMAGTVGLMMHTETSTVICGDSRMVLPTFEKESMDCVATDPPYGTDWQSNTRKESFARMEGDATLIEAADLLSRVTPEMVRVLRRTRHVYTFGLALEHPLLPVKTNLVWNKGRIGSGDLSNAWGPSHELIFFHVRAADKTNANKGAGGLTARLRRGSIINVRRLSALQVKRHPTEKPVELMAHLIESSTVRGEVVLDPFAGSGSTGVAAVLTGRRCVLIERDPAFAEMCVERLTLAERLMSQAVGI